MFSIDHFSLALDPEQIDDIKDDIEYYIESSEENDGMLDMDPYETIDMEELPPPDPATAGAVAAEGKEPKKAAAAAAAPTATATAAAPVVAAAPVAAAPVAPAATTDKKTAEAEKAKKDKKPAATPSLITIGRPTVSNIGGSVGVFYFPLHLLFLSCYMSLSSSVRAGASPPPRLCPPPLPP